MGTCFAPWQYAAAVDQCPGVESLASNDTRMRGSVGHAATMVPLFASGPGAERFGGVKETWEIGVLLIEAVGS